LDSAKLADLSGEENMIWTLWVFLGTMVPYLVVGVIVLASVETQAAETIKKSFAVAAGGRLAVETDRGTIEVRTTESPTVEIEVKELDGLEIEVTQNGNDVHVRGTDPSGSWPWRWWVGNWRGPKFLISVPYTYNVDLSTAGGSVSVADLEGEVRSKTSGGSLQLGRIQGPVRGETSGGNITLAGSLRTAQVETAGGSIDIGEVEGDVNARTSGGSIRVAKVTGRVVAETSGGSIEVGEAMNTVEATTSGGSVTASLSRQPQGDSRLETSGGTVAVFLAEAVAVDIDAYTSGGRVTTALPIARQEEFGSAALQAKVNNGGPKLILRTSGGNIRVGKL
jgi:DUF4097 and DUF4098 domain-containing protein YvlB